MLDDFLELCGGFRSTVRCQVSFSAHIERVQIRPVVVAVAWQSQFTRTCRRNRSKRLLWIEARQCQLGTQRGEIVALCNRVFRKSPGQFIREHLRLLQVAREGKSEGNTVGDVSIRNILPCDDRLFLRAADVAKQGFANGSSRVILGADFFSRRSFS